MRKVLFVFPILISFIFAFSSCNNSKQSEDETLVEEIKTESKFLPVENLNFDLSFQTKNNFDSGTFESNFQSFSKYYSRDTTSIFCFRGNAQRNNPSRGRISGRPVDIVEKWVYATAYDTTTTEYGMWGGGAGWTGQPLLINWTKEQKEKLGIENQLFIENDDAMELIIGSLCGDVYFLDAQTGKETRDYVSIENPIKGTVSVDPRKNGLLYIGQGIKHGERFGAYIYDMFQKQELLYINGMDAFSYRGWAAFDSNPIVDRKSGTIFWPGENGLIYKINFGANRKKVYITKLRYKHKNLVRQGIESSMAVIDKYGFIADNCGSILCIDLQKMEVIWNIDNFDDTDATIVIDQENNGSYYLYIGNEVDIREPFSLSTFRKIDARDGSEIWRVERPGDGSPFMEKTNSGGVLATALMGKHKGDSLVYCLFSRIDKAGRGEFVAINKYSGKEKFTVEYNIFSWSSPIDLYDDEGNIYIFSTDVARNLYLIDGYSGELILKKKSRFNFEASPIAFNDNIYIASRGRSVVNFELIFESKDDLLVEIE